MQLKIPLEITFMQIYSIDCCLLMMVYIRIDGPVLPDPYVQG